MHTEHFDVTFHTGGEQVAEEMAAAAETAWDKLTVEIETAPKNRVQIILIDWTDSANGSAGIVPNNTIIIYVTAPGGDSVLGLYEDWNEAIITHELTHILHLDTVEGLPAVGRAVMGRIISTNEVSPLWTVEGYATFEETRQTHGGRGRSAGVDMVKRAAILDHRFPRLGNLDGLQALPPSGNLRYLFGQDFMQFIADTRGEEKWTEWVHRYGSSIPFFLPAKRTFGAGFPQLWREWKAEVERRYADQLAIVDAEGTTPTTTVSPAQNGCGAPAWSPDGKSLAYACSDPKRGVRTWLADEDGKNAKVLLKSTFADGIFWRADSKAFAYSSMHNVGLYNSYDDVFLYDIARKRTTALTFGKRARDAAFTPDGGKMIAVTNEQQTNQLAVLGADQRLLPITDLHDHTQFSTPRYSPDGNWIAVSVWREGLRDLWVYTTDGRPWRRITFDTAIDIDPVWSADGKTLFFTSDRSGIPNVYALDIPAEHLFRVTNVRTGAYGASPRPDGKKLAFQLYSSFGPQVAIADLDRAAWKDLGLLPTVPGSDGALSTPPTVIPVANDRAEPTPLQDAKTDPSVAFSHPVTPYNPLPTLFPPRYWLPSTLFTTTGTDLGLYVAAYTGGNDPLGTVGYSAYATYRTDANFVGGGGSFVYNRWRPVFSIGVGTYVSPYGDIYSSESLPSGGGATIPTIEDTGVRYWDHRIRASTSVWYPLDGNSGISAYYKAEFREPKDALPDGAYLPSLPTRGFFSSVGAGWSYGKGESYTLSISPEKARSLGVGLEYTSKYLGSSTLDDTGASTPFDQVQASAEWREYTTNPWVPNHVLATKVTGGATFGDHFRYGSYRLGGSFSEYGITVVPDEWRSLRGFYPSTDSGEWFWLASAEYRFPLWQIDHGFGTLPFFLRNLSGAVIADAGNAFDDTAGASLDQTLLGVGAEVRLSAILFYGYPFYGRLGYAVPVNGSGIDWNSINAFYATVGSSF